MESKSIDETVELLGVEIKQDAIKNPHLKRILSRISDEQQFKHRYNNHSRYSEKHRYSNHSDYCNYREKYSEYSNYTDVYLNS